MLEELVSGVVDGGGARVVLEDALAGELLGEVLACVEELEEATYGLDVLVWEVYLAGLGRSLGFDADCFAGTHAAVVDKGLADLGKVGTLSKQGLVRCEAGGCFRGPN